MTMTVQNQSRAPRLGTMQGTSKMSVIQNQKGYKGLDLNHKGHNVVTHRRAT